MGVWLGLNAHDDIESNDRPEIGLQNPRRIRSGPSPIGLLDLAIEAQRMRCGRADFGRTEGEEQPDDDWRILSNPPWRDAISWW